MVENIQILSVTYEGKTLKFESLILFNYFLNITKQEKFKDHLKDISDKIMEYFEEYSNKHNIIEIENLKAIEEHIESFQHILQHKFEKEFKDMYDYMSENIFNNVKVINLYYDDFVSEMIKVVFFKLLNLRNKFFGL